VGVTAGASAPEELVEAIIAFLAPVHGVETVRVTEEDEYFPPTRNIRELQTAIGLAAAAMMGGPREASASFDDRGLAASDVLATLRSS
jgi:4-hydroxy-3-methylbut-2-enyl diphosphate reductase